MSNKNIHVDDNVAKNDKQSSDVINEEKSIDQEIITPEDKISLEVNLEEQLAETKDQLLRALAEVENTRKRAKKEKDEATLYAITKFARDMLTVNDNLDRAIKSVKNDNNDEIASLLEGVKITQKEIHSIFSKYEINVIQALNTKFDPNFHQAMFEIENKEQEPGTVIEEVQTGYKIADRLLRPAMVGIVKN